MDRDDDSVYLAFSGKLLPRRFPEPTESDYLDFMLRVFRPGIRAWHTAALTLVLVLLITGTLFEWIGHGHASWHPATPPIASYKLWLLGIAIATRAALCALSWRRDFVRVYPAYVLPLTIVGHACANALFGTEVFGPHPGYVGAIAVYAFAVSLLSGLRFRQALIAHAVAIVALILAGSMHPVPASMVVPVVGQIVFAMLLAGVAAIALERSVRALFLENRRVGEMAARDGLTGLKNRRAFDEHLRQVWQLALRNRRGLAVMLIDVDFFKAFNDSLGHQAGDDALQRIAAVVGKMARRPLDMSARYGGEELAVILFDVTKDYVVEATARVQRMVEDLKIVHPGSTVAPFVTVSTGVAFVWPTLERSMQGAIRLADRGLYAAKREGRNRSVILDRDLEFISTGVLNSVEVPVVKAASG